ncbi:ribbon-helix-helix protein, CopG family [Sphingomonas antarctica]|uniref:ribbon-helix-helix protein, CopG family n=1 Tax=Sphingomonas antarctica TaxID=2040274 RepID=UPI0039EAC14A
MRTLVDIPDDDVRRLDDLAVKGNRSRAAEIREAVKRHLQDKGDLDWIARGAGYWANRDDIPDGVEYQRAMREDQDLGFEWPPRSSTPTS